MGLNYPSMPLSRVTLSAVCSTGPLEAWQPIKIMKQPVTVTVVLFFLGWLDITNNLST